MNLSDLLIERYAEYRYRLLNGIEDAVYAGPRLSRCSHAPVTNVDPQEVGAPMQFLRGANSDRDPSVAGVLLHVDRIKLSEDSASGAAPKGDITEFYHGDQVVYLSYAFLAFAAEYRITYLRSSLEMCRDIIATLARLGSYANGFSEPSGSGNAPWGYTLRHDAIDDPEASFCTWLGVADRARAIEPSYDQLGSINNCLALGHELLSDPAVLVDPEWPISDASLLDELTNLRSGAIAERLRATNNYVADCCRYYLRVNHDHFRPYRAVDRGAWCWQFAYPLARIQARVFDGNPETYPRYLANFLWSFLFDATDLVVTGIIEAIVDFVVEAAWGGKHGFQSLENELDAALRRWDSNFVDKARKYFGDVIGDIFDGLRDELLKAVNDAIFVPLRDLLVALRDSGADLTSELNRVLAKALFETFSRSVLGSAISLDPDSQFPIELNAKTLFGDVSLTRTIRITKSWDISTPAIPRLAIPEHSWGTFSFDFPMQVPDWSGILDAITTVITVPISILGESLWRSGGASEFVEFHFFVANVAADSFGKVGLDPTATARRFRNAFYTALIHTFKGGYSGDQSLMRTTLESAPSDFPHRGNRTGWNQDFRWLRGRKDVGDGSEVYSGLDFILATAVAGAKDPASNRQRLRDAIESRERDPDRESEGVAELPFASPLAVPFDIYKQESGVGYHPFLLCVIFDGRDPDGGMDVTCYGASGALLTVAFSQREPAKGTTLPAGVTRITITGIRPRTRGRVLLGSD